MRRVFMKSGASAPASICSNAHEGGAAVCISSGRRRLPAVCLITIENELIFPKSPRVDIELQLWGSQMGL